MNLTEFLLARIAEDEAEAERAASHNGRGVFARDNYGCLLIQPARVLAECDAKRRIVEIHALDPDPEPDENWAGLCAICDSTQEGYPCATLRALALPYADHPDFDEAWRA